MLGVYCTGSAVYQSGASDTNLKSVGGVFIRQEEFIWKWASIRSFTVLRFILLFDISKFQFDLQLW